MKLYAHNYNGNLHELCNMINSVMPKLVPNVIHFEGVSGSLSIAIFRVTDEQYKALTDNSKSFFDRLQEFK